MRQLKVGSTIFEDPILNKAQRDVVNGGNDPIASLAGVLVNLLFQLEAHIINKLCYLLLTLDGNGVGVKVTDIFFLHGAISNVDLIHSNLSGGKCLNIFTMCEAVT